MEHKKRKYTLIFVMATVMALTIGLGSLLVQRDQDQANPSPTQLLPTQEAHQITTSTISPTIQTTEHVPVVETIHEHSYTVKKHVPTCTGSGFTTHICECGDTYRSDETNALGHKYGAVKETEATCTAKGGQVKTCSVCGHESLENAVAALGHDWSAWETTKETTTTSTGEQIRTCGRCAKTEQKTIPKLKGPEHDHTYTKTVVAPTCMEKGYTRYTCDCGKSYDADIKATIGHLYGDWETVSKPTATSEGRKEATCRWCGNIISKSVPKLTDEEVELYKKYIDPKIEILSLPDGAKSYRYKKVAVIDTRSWGEPPAIKVVDDSAFAITYAKKDGTIVKFTLKATGKSFF